MPHDKDKAEKLKALANELYGKKDFKAAYQKYTEAIKADGTNAIYYANRAATSLAMQQYMDACADANKAIALDPIYVKGHARLAAGNAGLGMWTSAAEGWKRALALLPQVDAQLTATERKLKEQFLSELRKAEQGSNRTANEHSIAVGKDDLAKTPWERAIAEEAKLRADGNPNSSGWVMLHAYHEFSEGVNTMKTLKTTTIGGKQALFGRTDGLTALTNGIMRDSRVFHLDSRDWFEKYNKQTMFEVQKSGAWSKVGPKVIMEEAPKRLRKEGWDSVRPAISTTIRAWFMAGCLAYKMSRQLGAAYEYFTQAVQLLEWGQKLWHDVPSEDRGVVFERTFIRGVKRLKLEVMLARLIMKENCPYTKKQVADEALAIIEDIEANPPQGEFDPGFYLSFWVYPKAEALATVGWYHMQTGLSLITTETGNAAFTESGQYYTQASSILPPDEETSFQYLYVALESLWFSSQPIQKQLPLFIKLDKIGQAMMRFWMISPTAEQRNGQLKGLMAYRDQVLSGLSSGKYKNDSIVKPSTIKALEKGANPATTYIQVDV